MTEYRLSLRARADLINIYAGFERTFGLLAEFPAIGASADELVPGYRRFRFQSHYIFYSAETDHVLIRALIHVRQSLRPALFE